MEYCFTWNNTERKFTANEFSLIIVYFIEKYVIYVIETTWGKKVTIILFNNGCTYQNCNPTLSNTYRNYCYTKIFTNKLCSKNVGSMYSKIERKIRNKKSTFRLTIYYCAK